MKLLWLLVISFVLLACRNNDTVLIIQETYAKDSASRGESFKDMYLKIRFPLEDSLLTRLSYPFKVTRKLNRQDWMTESFTSFQALRKSPLCVGLIKAIRTNVPYDESYRTIFANLSTTGQSIKIIRSEKDIGFCFISENGRWFLSEYSESLVEF